MSNESNSTKENESSAPAEDSPFKPYQSRENRGSYLRDSTPRSYRGERRAGEEYSPMYLLVLSGIFALALIGLVVRFLFG
jgi:hypothetical protein